MSILALRAENLIVSTKIAGNMIQLKFASAQ